MAGTLKSLVQQCRKLADLGLSVGRDPTDAPANSNDRVDSHWKNKKRDKSEKPILIEHHADEEDDGDRVFTNPSEHISRRTTQESCVAGKTRDQGAGRIGMKISEVGTQQASKKRNLHIGDNALADPGHEHGFAVIGEA